MAIWVCAVNAELRDDIGLDRAKEVLRKAGASESDLVSYERSLLGLSPRDVDQRFKRLLSASPASVANTIQFIRLDGAYTLGKDSLPQPGVPKGEILEFEFRSEGVFPGTTRNIQIYIPDQYRADRPACVYVGLDGLQFSAPIVFDNLIHRNEMPVTIAIGVSSGQVQSAVASENPRSNRSFEFDTLSGDLAHFLLEEVFPEVQRRRSAGGLPIYLSNDPDDRAAGGISTGAIAAFTLAWEQPDQFRRVFSASGTFVGMRGGDQYPVLVRKTEPKPIRVFLQDGAGDHMDGTLGEVGDWWMSNQAMQRALDFSGYQVSHAWGEGPHGSRQGAVVFPEAMRWLWKDWPAPVASARESKNVFLHDILLAGESWKAVTTSSQGPDSISADTQGEIIAFDPTSGGAWRLNDGHWTRDSNLAPYSDIAFGAAGRAYVTDLRHSRLFAYSADGRLSQLLRDVRDAKAVVTHNGHLFVTDSTVGGRGRLRLIRPQGGEILLDNDLPRLSALALTPDEKWLSVASEDSRWGYIYRVESDYSATHRQKFYWFHIPDATGKPGPSAWVTDSDGRLYASTGMGVQVLDRSGRVRAILPVPGGVAIDLTFGGADFDTLFVLTADKRIYRRRLNVRGVKPGDEPIKLPDGNGA